MNLIKKLLNLKRKAPPAARSEVEAEEVPTMVIDAAPFRTYRLLRQLNGGTSRQAESPTFHMLASR